MKKNLFIITILIALLSVSCETWLDVNTDPNNPTEVTPDLVLPVAQNYTAQSMQRNRGINHLGNMFMYNWSETYGFSWYDEEFKYLVTTTFYDGIFDRSYRDPLKQYAVLDDLGEDYGTYAAISKIMKTYHFQLLVDLYGDIPYSEALLRGALATPRYDAQEDIYEDLIVKLSEAITQLKASDTLTTNVAPGADDVMFGGNTTDWIRFANTLKIRILTRVSDVATAEYLNTEIATIMSEGTGFITADVAVNPGYLQEQDKQNRYWEDLGWDVGGTVRLNHDATCATQYILDYLSGTNDPRINYMYEKPKDGHKGVEQGSNPGEDYGADFVSNIGFGHLKAPEMDAVIFTLAEHNFNMAELAQEGFAVGGTPNDFYDDGIRASFRYLIEVSDTINADSITVLADTYLSQALNNVSFAYSANPIEAIITQKWLATNGITAEQSWFDYSRTGYPLNLPVSLLASTADRPVRLFYPASEITANTANVPAQPDAFTEKIFWGK